MGTDIVEQVIEKLGDFFPLQLDESTNVRSNAQLVTLVRYVHTDDIYDHILFCKALEGKTTGEDIVNVVNTFFCKNGFSWKLCYSICMDAAASMMGSTRALIVRIKQENPDIRWTHCVIHWEALVSKRMSPVLHDILNDSIKVINFIKSTPLNACLFRRTCCCTQRCASSLEGECSTGCWNYDPKYKSPHTTLFQDTDRLTKL